MTARANDLRRENNRLSFFTPAEIEAMLPKVGDRLRRVPKLHKESDPGTARPLPCVVLYVNKAHRWYPVQFDNGLRESYKLPRVEGSGTQQRVVHDG